MKKTMLMTLALVAMLVMIGCSEDDSVLGPEDSSSDSLITTIDNSNGSFSTVVNGGGVGATEWVYYSFTNGEVEVTEAASDLTWDLRVRFYTVQLNGGYNGSAGLELAYDDDATFAGMTAAPVEGYVTDTEVDDAFKTDGGWYTYNPTTHETILNGRIWCLHMADNSYIKVEMDNLLDDAGSPGFPGFTWQMLN